MKTPLLIFLSFIWLTAAAEDKAYKKTNPRKPAQTNRINVSPTDEHFSTEELEKRGYNTQVEENIPENERIPLAGERDLIFLKAGILKSLQKWQEIEKDIFFMRARHYSLPDLQKRYPKIPASSLRKLQNTMKEQRRQ